MPSLTLTNPTLSTTFDSTEVDANFADLLTLVNGQLDNDNVAAAAGLNTTKLDAYNYEMLANLRVFTTAAAAAPAASATKPIAVVGLPGSTTDGIAYTLISGGYLITNAGTGGGNTTWTVELGYMNAGAWVKVGSSIVAATNIAASADMQSGAVTLATTSVTLDATNKYFLALFVTAVAADALNTAYDEFSVTLKLRRTSGLR